jgi:hypothetical protein
MLLAHGIDLSGHAERIRSEFQSFRDERLRRFLTAHRVEVKP